MGVVFIPFTRCAIVVTLALISGFMLVLFSSEHSSAAEYDGTGREIVAAGEQYLGWGYGHGNGEIMCSGLTSRAVGRATGVDLPLNPGAQMAYGWEPKRMKPGDLMFFSEDGKTITHTGIYVGDGMILHASDYFMEVVESDYTYIDGFVGVRRIR